MGVRLAFMHGLVVYEHQATGASFAQWPLQNGHAVVLPLRVNRLIYEV